MNEELSVNCPYCGEVVFVEPEPSARTLEYIEDCAVCCRPIIFTVTYSEEGSQVSARAEDD
jgi:hypothetical protein